MVPLKWDYCKEEEDGRTRSRRKDSPRIDRLALSGVLIS